MRKIQYYLFCLFTLIIVGGCSSAATYSSEKDFGLRLKTMKKVGVVIPAVEIYELGAGGSVLYDAERTKESRKHFERATLEAFAGNEFKAVLLPTAEDILAVIDYHRVIRSNYSPPSNSIALRPASQSEMESVLTRYGVDIIAIVEAKDHVSTGGRKAVLTTFAMLGVVGRGGMSNAYISLVDKTGSCIFFDSKPESNDKLTDYGNVESVIESMVENIVKAAKLPER